MQTRKDKELDEAAKLIETLMDQNDALRCRLAKFSPGKPGSKPEDTELVWGLKSGDDLTGAATSTDTMNDIELVHWKDTNTYTIDVETAYSYEDPADAARYLSRLLEAFTAWMNEQGHRTDYTFHPHTIFAEGRNLESRFDSIEEAYACFRLMVNGFCSQFC